MDLPGKVVLQLLEQKPDRVRVIDQPVVPQPGCWVTFHSPLFGICVAKIKKVETTRIIITDHSVLGTDQTVSIPFSWIQQVYKENQ